MAGASTTWTVQSTPNPSTVLDDLTSVSCRSTSDCTAVGFHHFDQVQGFVPYAERWNGKSWTVKTLPTTKYAYDSELDSVSCATSTWCMAVGQYADEGFDPAGLAEKWDGVSWRVQSMPEPSSASAVYIYSVSCTSPTSCMAAGETGSVQPSGWLDEPLIEHWNGSSWRILPTPNLSMGGQLEAVSCRYANRCTAVGYVMTKSPFPAGPPYPAPLAERWNGNKWVQQPMSTPSDAYTTDLQAVSCPSLTECVAVGFKQIQGLVYEPMVQAWNGTKWSVKSAPMPSTESRLTSVSCPSATACTAIGSILRGSTDLPAPFAERWNGSKWTTESMTYPSKARWASEQGVSCPTAIVCTAVGDYLPGVEFPLALIERR